jgi:tetratricopeptide (TPR) repeat protein
MRAACIVLAVLIATSPVSAADDARSHELRQANKLTTKGNRALETGNLTKAKQFYEKALTSVPDFPDAHLGLGHVAMRERKFQQALRSFERANDGYLEMNHVLFRLEQDAYHDAQGKLAELRAQLAALEANQRNLEAAAQQGDSDDRGNVSRTLYGINMNDQARIARLEQEIFRLEGLQPPTQVTADRVPGKIHFFRGNALMNLNRTDEAIEAWETCARDEPGFAPVYNNLAVAYFRTGRLEYAERAVRKAEELGITVHPQFKADLARARGASASASAADAE